MNIRPVITLLLLMLVMVFAVQNSEIAEVELLFWQFEFPRSLLTFMMLLIGVVIGWFSRAMFRFAKITD